MQGMIGEYFSQGNSFIAFFAILWNLFVLAGG